MWMSDFQGAITSSSPSHIVQESFRWFLIFFSIASILDAFEPMQWVTIAPRAEYRAESRVRLHVVTDWATAAVDETNGMISMLDLFEHIHDALAGLSGDTLMDFTLTESHTNYNHEDIVENIEIYGCSAFKSVGM